MRLPALVRFAAGSLWRQKARTLLTVAGVAVGAGGLAFSLSLGLGLRAFVDREFRGRPQFWAVQVGPGRGPPVPEEAIPAEAVAVPGAMSAERRERLQRFKVADYRARNPAGPPARLTADRLAELAALPGVDRVDAWHQHVGTAALTADGRRRQAQVAGGPTGVLAARLVAGRLPAAGEAVASERLLYDLGLHDEAAVAAALGHPIRVEFPARPARPFGVHLATADRTGLQDRLLDRVADALPKAVDAMDLTAAEKDGLRRLLAAAPRPAADRFTPAEPAAAAPVLVGVARDLTEAERYAPDTALGFAERYGEVFLPPAGGDGLFGRLPWVREFGYGSATVRVTPGGDLAGVVAGVEAAGFEAHHLLPFYRAAKLQATLTAAGLNLFALLALGVAGLGITNTLVTSVVERTREVGMLRAVGATGPQVRRLFLAEGAAVGLVGGLVGLAGAAALTVPADRLVHRLIGQVALDKVAAGPVFAYPGWLGPAAVGFAVLATTAAAWYPARRAARLDPVAALRG